MCAARQALRHKRIDAAAVIHEQWIGAAAVTVQAQQHSDSSK